VFSKWLSSPAGPVAEIPLPTDTVDWELQLVAPRLPLTDRCRTHRRTSAPMDPDGAAWAARGSAVAVARSPWR
jgi:hypothetical protein